VSNSDPSLTIFYIVEPPEYEIMASYLLASIRTRFPGDVKAIGYCPEHRYDELHPAVHIAHEKMGAEIRTFKSDGRLTLHTPMAIKFWHASNRAKPNGQCLLIQMCCSSAITFPKTS
jgi:hypothetical protein